MTGPINFTGALAAVPPPALADAGNDIHCGG
jgi:hypothetical protein